jgi:hypothetical protein
MRHHRLAPHDCYNIKQFIGGGVVMLGSDNPGHTLPEANQWDNNKKLVFTAGCNRVKLYSMQPMMFLLQAHASSCQQFCLPTWPCETPDRL